MTIFKQRVREWHQHRNEFITDITLSENREDTEAVIKEKFPYLSAYVVEGGVETYRKKPGQDTADCVYRMLTQFNNSRG